MLKVILIDPYAKTVSEVETTHEIKDWYKLLDCSMVELVAYGREFIVCDEEALLTNKDKGFTLHARGYQSIPFIAGKAFLATSYDGDLRDATSSVADIESQIIFCKIERNEQGFGRLVKA